eukprot:SAG25_NODE_1293_length_3372_cov_1.915063_4_plen_76_part_00
MAGQSLEVWGWRGYWAVLAAASVGALLLWPGFFSQMHARDAEHERVADGPDDVAQAMEEERSQLLSLEADATDDE